MDDNNARALNAATGEALQCSVMLSALLMRLVQKGVLAPEEVVDLADAALLILEKHRATAEGAPGAIDHARVRLEATIAMFSTKQGQERSA